MSNQFELSDLGTIITGNTPPTSKNVYYSSDDICLIKPSDFRDEIITTIRTSGYYVSEAAKDIIRLLPVGSILVTCIGTIGKIAVTEIECATNQQINAIIPNIGVCGKFLAFALLSMKQKIIVLSNAAVVPIINKNQFSKIVITLPQYKSQCQIASTLDAVSEVLRLRKAQLAELDSLVKARFVEMFGEPGTDEMGWGLTTLGECCEINPKKSADKRLVSGFEVSFVPMQAVSENGDINPSETKVFDEVKTGFTYFIDNDVLFAKITPCMENGKGAVAVGLRNCVGFGSTEFHVLRPVKGISNPYWIYFLTTHNIFRKDAAANMTGSAGQRRVPTAFLDNFRIALPPIGLQKQFAEFVQQLDKSKIAVQKTLDETQRLFDSLMSEYFE